MDEESVSLRLPAEIVEEFMLYLNPKDLASCLGVDDTFRETCNWDKIWCRAIKLYLPRLMRIIEKEDWVNHLPLSSIPNAPNFRYPNSMLREPASWLKCYMKHRECNRKQYNGEFSLYTHTFSRTYDYNFNGILITTTHGDRVKFYDVRHDLQEIHTIYVDADSSINNVMLTLDMFLIHYSEPVAMDTSTIQVYDITYTSQGVEFKLRYQTSFTTNDTGYVDANHRIIFYHAYGDREFHVVDVENGKILPSLALCSDKWSVSEVRGQLKLTKHNYAICVIGFDEATDDTGQTTHAQTALVYVDVTTRKQKCLVNLAENFQLWRYNSVLSEDNRHVCVYDSSMGKDCINRIFVIVIMK